MTVTVEIGGIDYSSKFSGRRWSRQNSLGIGNFELFFVDGDDTIYSAIQQDDTIKVESNDIILFYGIVTKIDRISPSRLQVSGLSYKGNFNKVRPIYQFWETDRKEIAQKLINKSLASIAFDNDTDVTGTREIATSDRWIATKIPADIDYQFLDSVEVRCAGCNYLEDETSGKSYVIAAIYPDDGTGDPDTSSSPETYSIFEPPIFNNRLTISGTPDFATVRIDFKDNVDISTQDKWLVLKIMADSGVSDSIVTFQTDTTATTNGNYTANGGSTWTAANPVVTYFYTTKSSFIDFSTYFDTGTEVNYSIEHNTVSNVLKDLTESEGYSFFDNVNVEDGPFSYIPIESSTAIDSNGNTSVAINSSPLTFTTDRFATANSALVMNGTNTRLNPVDATVGTLYNWPNEFFVSFWCAVTSHSGVNEDIIFSTISGGTNGVSLVITTSSFYKFTVAGVGGGSITSDDIVSSSYQNVVIKRDNSGIISMFIDGVKQSDTMSVTKTIDTEITYSGDPTFTFGDPSSLLSYNGKIDQIAISKDVNISDESIAKLYDNTYDYTEAIRTTDTLFLHWENSTNNTNVGICDIDDSVNVIKYNIKQTEVVNSCRVYGIDKDRNEIFASYEDSTSIGTYTRKELVLRFNNLNSYEECYNAAKRVVEQFKDPNLTGSIIIKWSTADGYNTDYLFPGLVQVDIAQKSISDTYLAQTVTWNYPQSTVQLDFAEDLNTFKEVVANLSKSTTDLKQAKNVQKSDNGITIDFTNSEYKPYDLVTSTNVTQDDGVGVTLSSTDIDDIYIGNIVTDKFQTDKKTNFVQADLIGTNIANSWVEQRAAEDLPIGNGFVSSCNYVTNTPANYGITFSINLNPLRYYGANEDYVFEFDMDGNTQKIPLEISRENDRRIYGIDSNINVVDSAMGAYYPTLFFVITQEQSSPNNTDIYVFNELWELVNSIDLTTLDASVTTSSVITGLGVTAYPDGSKIIIYVNHNNGTNQYFSQVTVDEDGTGEALLAPAFSYAFATLNREFHDISFINGNLSDLNNPPDFRFVAVSKNRSTGVYSIGTFNHTFTTYPSSSSFSYMYHYQMPCSEEYDPQALSVCSLYGISNSGTEDDAGYYKTLVSTIYDGDTEDNIYANEYIATIINDEDREQIRPYVFKRNVTNSFFLPTKGIARGLLNPVLRTLKADVFESHNTYTFPLKYLESDYL